ncbi:MAG: nucleoside monophosphate kinase [Candidatus Aminicenantes bacterium]
MLLVGPTGAGKTPLGRRLQETGFGGRPCSHFDFGARLREISLVPQAESLFTPVERGVIRTCLETGALLEDGDFPIAQKILENFVRARDPGPGGLIVLNGLPRHRAQAERLEGVVSMERIAFLDGTADVIRERLRLDTGGDRAGRMDDALDAVERRMAIFRDRTLPLLRFYEDLGVPVRRISVTAPMTAAEMAAVLQDLS